MADKEKRVPKFKWDEKRTARARELYEAATDRSTAGMQAIAGILNAENPGVEPIGYRNVIHKMVNIGVYETPEKVKAEKAVPEGPTKAQILAAVQEVDPEFDETMIEGFKPASKAALMYLATVKGLSLS